MLRRGEVFAGFVIERELGRGGMGAVYAARDRRLPRLTALKLMHRDLFTDFEIRTRFEREADLVAQLDHPNIITVYDRGVDEEQLWIAMQFVDGVDASAVPVQQFEIERIAQIVTQTASALDYAHRQGVLHRDVKPANILLSRTAGVGAGFDERVLLTDFGIAKLLDDTGGLTRTGQFTATIAYASPEQLSSAPLDGRGDQYSLACTVFRLLTGSGPFDAPNPATVMLGHINAVPPRASTRRSALPAAVDAVLAKAMAKDPTRRFPTCTDFAAAFTEALTRRAQAPPSGSLPIGTEAPLRTGALPPAHSAATRTASREFPDQPHARPLAPPATGRRAGTGAVPSSGTRADSPQARQPPEQDLARRLDPTARGAEPADSGPRIDIRHPDRYTGTSASGQRDPGKQAGAGQGSAVAPRFEHSRRSSDAVASAASVWLNAVHGCLVGGAIGDALGAPVETKSLHRIRAEYGHLGVSDDAADLRISEETQLTAFTVEALIRGSVRARAKGIGGATLGLLQQGMLVWLRGQVRDLPDHRFALHSSLSDHPELTEQRGVANSVYTALRQAAERGAPTSPLGTRDQPINNSKGSGAVMRAAPCGFGYAADRSGAALGAIFELGCDAAALTHGHPSGWLPAGTLAALVYRVSRGVDTAIALDHARAELASYPGHEETSAALDAAIALASRTARPGRPPGPEDLETLGQGWIGPEALALAVFAVLAAEAVGGPPHLIVRTGLLLSVNHSGDSDATGSIAGSLLGARYGRTALPHRWSRTVDARPVLDRLATDYCTEFGLTPPRDDHGQPTQDWFDRYPA
ncbi:ADP-ribosylglycohydrolase family protein [Nocardia sp. NPDC057663]|uniref:ADP-ribosylglycohydrolase family protein n=1 Tax=Nocardia sp. NPDC057663 TaxID=3346201 RepID=UPI00367159F3